MVKKKSWFDKQDNWVKGMIIGFVIGLIPSFIFFMGAFDGGLEAGKGFLFFVKTFIFALVMFSWFPCLGLIFGFILDTSFNEKKFNKQVIYGIIVGIILIILVNFTIDRYCDSIDLNKEFCLGMEHYPLEMYIFNILFIIPTLIVLSVLIFVILNKIRVLYHERN